MIWTSTDRPRVCAGVATFNPSDGSDTIVFDDTTRKWFRLPGTASAIWNAIDGQRTVADISRHVAQSYAADHGAVGADVVTMHNELDNLGLIEGSRANDGDTGRSAKL